MHAINVSISLDSIECGDCGIHFAIPDNLHIKMKQVGSLVYCPNGHRIGYAKTENQRLREKLDEQTRTATQMAERARIAEDRSIKLRKRVNAGVCPCCKRTFSQLARHMKSKHADHMGTKK